MMSVTMAKKRKPGRPKTSPDDLVVVQARVTPAMHAALEEAAALGRRTKNSELIIALEKHLESLNLWPVEEGE
jgi:hypothetical protein